MADERVTLKLLIDKNSNRVLFAEADKIFVDFLFTFLSLPLATVAMLLTKEDIAGSFGNLYDSVENLSRTHLHPNLNKDSLLKPTIPMMSSKSQATQHLLPHIKSLKESTRVIYRCVNNHSINFIKHCRNFVAESPNTFCPVCNNLMNNQALFVYPCPESGRKGIFHYEYNGYVKGVVNYRVMDDLTVEPMSDISSVTLLKKFNVKDSDDLEERDIDVDATQGLELLKASLQSKTVLTDVFLEKKLTKTTKRFQFLKFIRMQNLFIFLFCLGLIIGSIIDYQIRFRN